MELLNLFLGCFCVFGVFAIIEVVKLKKEVRKLNRIVEHLLKNEHGRQTEAGFGDDWFYIFSYKMLQITISLIVYNTFKLSPNI